MITSELFGTAPCGTPVHRYTLNGPEICVRIMDYGATVLGIDVPDIPGNVRDVVLGFDKLEDYFDNPACFGATIGPVANRTAGATDHHRRHGLAYAGQRGRQQPAQRS